MTAKTEDAMRLEEIKILFEQGDEVDLLGAGHIQDVVWLISQAEKLADKDEEIWMLRKDNENLSDRKKDAYAKLAIAEKALEYISDHAWTTDNKENAWKWINDFVDVSKIALKKIRGEK